MKKSDLRKIYLEAMEEIKEPIAEFPWRDRDHYVQWLGQSYYFLCHATRLLALAAANFKVPENDALHLSCIEHAQEEKRHERLAINDLKALGTKIESIPELPQTAQLYQSQYYLIDYVNPAALFGSVLYLEGLSNSVGKDVYQIALKTYGKSAATFLQVHVTEDENHIEGAFKAVENCTSEQLTAIVWSLRQNAAIYVGMLGAIRASLRHTGRKAA